MYLGGGCKRDSRDSPGGGDMRSGLSCGHGEATRRQRGRSGTGSVEGGHWGGEVDVIWGYGRVWLELGKRQGRRSREWFGIKSGRWLGVEDGHGQGVRNGKERDCGCAWRVPWRVTFRGKNWGKY